MTLRRNIQRLTATALLTAGAANTTKYGPTKYAALTTGNCHDHSSGPPNLISAATNKAIVAARETNMPSGSLPRQTMPTNTPTAAEMPAHAAKKLISRTVI